MLNIIKNIISTLTTDTTMHSYVADRIYPQGVDIYPESAQLPAITLNTVSEVSLSNPRNERMALIQLDIWTRKNQLEAENIAERIITVLNYQQFTSGNTIQRWQREDSGVDMYESDRKIWHKSLTFRVWGRN